MSGALRGPTLGVLSLNFLLAENFALIFVEYDTVGKTMMIE
jgi:hypothetical protein